MGLACLTVLLHFPHELLGVFPQCDSHMICHCTMTPTHPWPLSPSLLLPLSFFFFPLTISFSRVLLPEMLRLAQILIFSRGFFCLIFIIKLLKKKKIMKLIKCVNFLTVNRLISYTIHCHMFGAMHHTVKHIWGLACQLLFVTLPMIYNHVWAYWADNDLVVFFSTDA